ncbi:MAG: branched chain amino acid aminotransferase [Cyclobacteriaceae bacterium]|nr:MAG: branched chain amino acid aminotransferase [Cyclobacteriaceae bacterium]
MTEKRISLWSGPRNVSTALMYSFAQRPDTTVLDEPLYGHYLSITDVQHPGRDEVLQSMELDGSKVIVSLCHDDYSKPVLFVKNMAHHLVKLDLSFLDDLHNVLLIRDPKEMLPSMVKQLPNPVLRDTGLKQQWKLYNRLLELGNNPVIIDSKELLLNPETILVKVCHILDIPFFQEMMTWTAGPIKEDGIWSKYWYESVHDSTGFQPYKPKKDPVPDHLTELWQECDHFYQLLYREALKVRS